MKVTVVAVGKVKDAAMRALLDDYAQRLRHYCKYEEVQIPDASPSDVQTSLARAFRDRTVTVALEVHGQTWSSERLAKFVGQCEGNATAEIAFLIGGSFGLPKAISERAHVQLSLSAMTLPHRLARLVLFEQIYRAFTILRGEPYSH